MKDIQSQPRPRTDVYEEEDSDNIEEQFVEIDGKIHFESKSKKLFAAIKWLEDNKKYNDFDEKGNFVYSVRSVEKISGLGKTHISQARRYLSSVSEDLSN